jgi:hypothetical protein
MPDRERERVALPRFWVVPWAVLTVERSSLLDRYYLSHCFSPD